LKKTYSPILLSLGFGILAWILDGILDYLYFYEGTFLELLLIDIPAHELYIRFVILICFILFGIIISFHIKQLQKEKKNYTTTFQSIGDGIITTNNSGQVQQMNSVSENLTGWKNAQAWGKPIEDVFQISNSRTGEKVENPVNRVLKEGKIVGLANDTLLTARNGQQYQIADSAAPIKNRDGTITGVVLIFRDITEQYELRTKIKENEQFLSEVFEAIQESLCVLTPDLTIERTNSKLKNWYEKKNPLKGKKCFDAFHDRDIPCHPCAVQQCIKSGQPEREIVRGLDQDEENWFEIFAYPIKDSQTGQVTKIVEFSRDITQRKQAEEALRKSEEKYRALFNSIRDAILVADTERKIVDCNPAFADLFGYELSDIEGKLTKYVYKDEQEYEEMGEKISRHIDSEKDFLYTIDYKKKSGQIFPGETNVFYLKNDQNEVTGFIGLIRDITERQRIEDELQEQKTMLERTEKIARVGSWEWDIATDNVVWSEELYKIFQMDPDQESPTFAEHKKLYVEEDMQRLREAVEKAVANGTPYKLELRAIRKDGEIRHCIAHGQAELGKDGKPIRLFGSLQDITERKRMEEKLKDKMEDLKRHNKFMVGREIRMIELKKEINKLSKECGQNPRYQLKFLDDDFQTANKK